MCASPWVLADGTGVTTRGPILVIGGGGHALVVIEAARRLGFDVAGVYDDADRCVVMERFQIRRVGRLAEAGLRASAGLGDVPVIVAVGDLRTRETLVRSLAGPFARVVHPEACIEPSALLGEGVYVGPRAVVHTFARVGAHAIINSGAIVEHECDVGPACHIAPGAILAGRVRVGAGAMVGLGARVLPGVQIGSRAVVGAGAVVLHDVPEGETVIGVPAKARARSGAG